MANKTHLRIRALCEGAILVALSFILSFVKLYQLPNGGSLTPAMLPILLYALRWGTVRGLVAGFVFGLLQLLFDGAYAWGWQSMILDYLLAFTGHFQRQGLGHFPRRSGGLHRQVPRALHFRCYHLPHRGAHGSAGSWHLRQRCTLLSGI